MRETWMRGNQEKRRVSDNPKYIHIISPFTCSLHLFSWKSCPTFLVCFNSSSQKIWKEKKTKGIKACKVHRKRRSEKFSQSRDLCQNIRRFEACFHMMLQWEEQERREKEERDSRDIERNVFEYLIRGRLDCHSYFCLLDYSHENCKQVFLILLPFFFPSTSYLKVYPNIYLKRLPSLRIKKEVYIHATQRAGRGITRETKSAWQPLTYTVSGQRVQY